MNDAYFTAPEQQKELNDLVPQFATDPGPVQLRSRLDGHTKDTDDYWQAELGPNGIAGVFKKLQPDHRSFEYYIVAQSGAPLAAQQLKSYVMDKELTFNELLQDANYHYVQDAARRNTLRLAYNVARAMKVPISHCDDYGASTGDANLGVPLIAGLGKNIVQPVSSMQSTSFEGEECAAVFHKCRPASLCGELAYVTASPVHGIVQFNMRYNVQARAVPSTVGVKTENVERKTLSMDRRQGLQWEGDETWNPRAHEDYYHNVDDEMLSKMSDLGWKQSGVDNRAILTPVQVKIGNPDLRRP